MKKESSTTVPDTADREHFEPEEFATREAMGDLRTVYYGGSGGTPHPDSRPCPPWCWVACSNGASEHEISPWHPFEAQHDSDGRAIIAASQYGGTVERYAGERVIRAAAIEGDLWQLGQGAPILRVMLRHRPKGQREEQYDEVLRLSTHDARELIKMLEHLVGLTEQ